MNTQGMVVSPCDPFMQCAIRVTPEGYFLRNCNVIREGTGGRGAGGPGAGAGGLPGGLCVHLCLNSVLGLTRQRQRAGPPLVSFCSAAGVVRVMWRGLPASLGISA